MLGVDNLSSRQFNWKGRLARSSWVGPGWDWGERGVRGNPDLLQKQSLINK